MNKSVELDIPLGTLVTFKFTFEGIADEKPVSYSASATAKLSPNPTEEQIQEEVNAVIGKLLQQQASENGWKSMADGKCEVELIDKKHFGTKVDATFK
jgi:hypothetical protein